MKTVSKLLQKIKNQKEKIKLIEGALNNPESSCDPSDLIDAHLRLHELELELIDAYDDEDEDEDEDFIDSSDIVAEPVELE